MGMIFSSFPCPSVASPKSPILAFLFESRKILLGKGEEEEEEEGD